MRLHPHLTTVLMILGLISSLASAGPTRYPMFDQADFTPPDVSDGDTVTVSVGDALAVDASCRCARQPTDVPCGGSIVIEVDDGSGFEAAVTGPCDVAEGEWCSLTTHQTFFIDGMFTFRIVCDEAVGADYVQDASERVTVTVEGPVGCIDGETRPCPIQEGVCAGYVETCAGGAWPGCDVADVEGYEQPETSCDGLDNDCDGVVDLVDLDGDGFGTCQGVPGIVNELLLTSADGVGGSIQVFEHRNGIYHEAWRTVTPDVPELTAGGGEAGDLTGDGVPEFALVREIANPDPVSRLEVWTFDVATGGWLTLWIMDSPSAAGVWVGDIVDADGDGRNELFVTNRDAGAFELYAYDGNGMSLEATVHDCSPYGAYYIGAGGDLNGDGVPELVSSCYTDPFLHIYEHDGGTYVAVGEVALPDSAITSPMIVDDMEHGDVNGDGRDDVVFCGNSGQVHVLTMDASTGIYEVEFSSPPPIDATAFSQTCSTGEITGDGVDDILVVNAEGAKVYSHDGSGYEEVWVGDHPTATPSIGVSYIGDSDNDGRGELLFGDSMAKLIRLYEGDGFVNSTSFGELPFAVATILVSNLNPENDVMPVDCDDGDPDQGVREVCADGLDNDCDLEVDEGCPTDICGDAYCAGIALGETCDTCPEDCACVGPSCRFGCCGDGVCGKREDALSCPVDCG